VKYRRRPGSVTFALNDDYTVFNDEVATRNADALFPGMTGDQAIEFRKKFAVESAIPVAPFNLLTLTTVACAAARAVDKPGYYFLQTRFYARQVKHVLRRLSRRYLGQRATEIIFRSHRSRCTPQ
jgi:hypothetical protein